VAPGSLRARPGPDPSTLNLDRRVCQGRLPRHEREVTHEQSDRRPREQALGYAKGSRSRVAQQAIGAGPEATGLRRRPATPSCRLSDDGAPWSRQIRTRALSSPPWATRRRWPSFGRVGSGQTRGGWRGSSPPTVADRVRGARPTPPWPEAATRPEQAKRDQDAAIAYAKDFGSSAAKAALPILMSAVL